MPILRLQRFNNCYCCWLHFAAAERYTRMPEQFDWYANYKDLQSAIRASFVKTRPVLHIGCGTSSLQDWLAKLGYTVVNVSAMQT
jgi:2-polyprenyl-3-methyl-5-hydroxy-6-metoxy-1,4-benzoquinol methylase